MHVSRKGIESFRKHFHEGDVTECWHWQGPLTKKGHGQLWDRGSHHLAHRVAFYYYRYPVPENCSVVHKCGNTDCVNPFHLQLQFEMRTEGGVARATAKLDEATVREIRQAYDQGQASYSELGRQYKVSRQAIWAIVTRINWSHVK